MIVFTIKGKILDERISPSITTDIGRGVGYHIPILFIRAEDAGESSGGQSGKDKDGGYQPNSYGSYGHWGGNIPLILETYETDMERKS